MSAGIWTVVGYYDGDGDAFCDFAEAEDPRTAMAVVAYRYEHPDLVIVGAVPGRHMLVTPGDDNGRTAYATDMAQQQQEDAEGGE